MATIFPALGEAGSVTVFADPDVSTKNPVPLVAVKSAVLTVVSQVTAPDAPKPVCVAPDARLTAPPHLPNVTVAPSTTIV